MVWEHSVGGVTIETWFWGAPLAGFMAYWMASMV